MVGISVTSEHFPRQQESKYFGFSQWMRSHSVCAIRVAASPSVRLVKPTRVLVYIKFCAERLPAFGVL